MEKPASIAVYMLKSVLRRHRFKLMCLGGTFLMAPLLPISVHGAAVLYRFSYRCYYTFALLSAV